MFSGRSLQSVTALLVYACQRIGRESGLNVFFALAPFYLPAAVGGVFRQISTIGCGSFSILFMSVSREGELGELRFLSFSCSIFPEWGGDGERVSVDLCPWRRRLWYTHVSVSKGRAN